MKQQSDILNEILSITKLIQRQLALKVGYDPTNITKRFKNTNSMKLIDLLDWLKKLDLQFIFKTKKLEKQIKSQKDIIIFIQQCLNVENNNQLEKVFPENYDALSLISNDKRKVSIKKVLEWTELLKIEIKIKKQAT